MVMRCKDGTVVEIFEWVSQRSDLPAPTRIRQSSICGKLFEAVCWYETPSNIPEFQNMFSHFEAL